MEKAGSNQEPTDAADRAQREQEATTKETLKDVVEKEKNPTASDDSHEKPLSPDGAFDENRELKDADPQ